MFQLHNETINVWSHLVGALLFVSLVFYVTDSPAFERPRAVAQATLQIMIKHERFSDDFGTKSRAWWSKEFGKALAMVEKTEAAIPADKWIEIPAEKHPDFDDMFGTVRDGLEASGAYDGKMLSTLKKIRCAADSSRAECAG